jgi:hypothetical protein
MSAEDQLNLERDYFVDDSAFERLLVVEDELVYDYLQGRLSPDRRMHFEATIGASERGRANLEFARALLSQLKSSPGAAAVPSRYWAMGIAAAVVLAVLPLWMGARLRNEMNQLRAESSATQARIEREFSSQRTARAQVEAVFLLTPGQSRGANGPSRLELSGPVDELTLELVPPPSATPGDYVVTIRSASGNQVWSQSAPLSGHTWLVRASASLFTPGSYEVAVRRLAAGEQPADLATYFFRVTRS